MTKVELISTVSEKTGLTKKDSEKALNGIIDSIIEALSNGEKVQLVGFGFFEVRQRAARKGHNPRTGMEIEIPASSVPAFKPGKAFKEAISK